MSDTALCEALAYLVVSIPVAGLAVLILCPIAAWLTDRHQRHSEHARPLRLVVEPPRDGALLGYAHPLGWPVRIVSGLPVAVGPLTNAARWSACDADWRWLSPADPLAREARELIQQEETVVEPRRQWEIPTGPLP